MYEALEPAIEAEDDQEQVPESKAAMGVEDGMDMMMDMAMDDMDVDGTSTTNDVDPNGELL